MIKVKMHGKVYHPGSICIPMTMVNYTLLREKGAERGVIYYTRKAAYPLTLEL